MTVQYTAYHLHFISYEDDSSVTPLPLLRELLILLLLMIHNDNNNVNVRDNDNDNNNYHNDAEPLHFLLHLVHITRVATYCEISYYMYSKRS